MITHGKFDSLTLINWNGFFARTFDLDSLVTTLSGGNGAGKSTTMAAFVTALIPDLTLLHFRNTTEAGATSGSRDKGLHGKLKPGVCYAILGVVNSRNQHIMCGVRLQQIAGRDKKVDIKPFVIQGLDNNAKPIELVTESLSERQVRILSLNELKDKLDASNIELKQFNSITEYHALMFELGVLPKRLRSPSDRSKYYRLIEASLYGGISSAITRSLRDYLLPENSGVRKAFQDMELALRENRMTLEAIKVTQSDRDLFKHLITESTNYVASDYMRHNNERRTHFQDAVDYRKELFIDQTRLTEMQYQHIELAKELSQSSELMPELEIELQTANQQLNLIQNAHQQQEKINRYQGEIEEISEQLLEKTEKVEEEQERISILKEKTEQTEKEVDDLKTQLSDYQQAVDVQQTRAIQYKKALEALANAQKISQIPDLDVNKAEQTLPVLEDEAEEITAHVIDIEQRLNFSDSAITQFETAFKLVEQISESDVNRENAYKLSQEILNEWSSKRYLAQQLSSDHIQLSDLEQRLDEQKRAQKNLQQLSDKLGKTVDYAELDNFKEELNAQYDQQNELVNDINEKRIIAEQKITQIQSQIVEFQHKAPTWLKSQDALNQLSELSESTFETSKDVTLFAQSLLEKERKLSTDRDRISAQKEQLNTLITQLNQPNGTDDERLTAIAERFNGVLLSEIYEDVSIEDAPYFSALYGPARQGIVVPNLDDLKQALTENDDLPEDIYFIEGDPTSFDDSVFDSEELENAVLVKTSERQWRLSQFPTVPLFGKAAREKRLDELTQERDELNEQYAIISFDLQKMQRTAQYFSDFIADHIATAFEINPENEIARLNSERLECQRQLEASQKADQSRFHQANDLKETLDLINRCLTQLHLLADDDLIDRIEEFKERVIEEQYAHQYVEQNKRLIEQLEPIATVLKSDPERNDELRQTHESLMLKQKSLSQQIFALEEVVQRREHLTYNDFADNDEGDLNSNLRSRLERIERERNEYRTQLKQAKEIFSQSSQALMTLRSSLQSRQEVLDDFNRELAAIGVLGDKATQEKAQHKLDELNRKVVENRQIISSLERQMIQNESEMNQLQRNVSQSLKEYRALRKQILESNQAWRQVLHLVKDHHIEKRLHKREMAYLSSEELRSMSDKALGSLRLAVVGNEHLRDELRQSEDPKRPERKIQFYIAVYQHLRDRIRQDIVKTDDPIEAIEQMEIELSRLTEELTSREQQLAISSKSVSNIIRKTIQREQNRVRLLNQGLQSVSFGQVNSVRLNVNIRAAHTELLMVLAEQKEEHQDLFNNNRISFSEALATLYQRLNPHIDVGQRSAQTIGEELLDYRNYLDLDIEVNRGADGWLRAESGALSTGEAIGTGMSILLMVTQSWEEESKRLRSKDIEPCRLLFLDEAARLDAKSIATLFELCNKLQMQLIIAAPENISPEKGTTYKLMRKVVNNQEHVHVVGLKGFA